jgi:hypothetical protein
MQLNKNPGLVKEIVHTAVQEFLGTGMNQPIGAKKGMGTS